MTTICDWCDFRGNEKKQKQQKDFPASGDSEKGTRDQKRKLRCQELKGRKKLKKLEMELESQAEFQCDPVEFGEVAPAPPSLPVLPRKAQLHDSKVRDQFWKCCNFHYI